MLLPTNLQRDDAASFVQAALDALSAHVAILDEDGSIIAVNAAWRSFADSNGYTHEQYGIGINYLQVCDAASNRKADDAAQVATGIRAILAGHKDEFELEYPCFSLHEKRWFVVRISRFAWYDNIRVIVAHQNVSDLKNAQLEQEANKVRLQAILDNITNGILTITPQGIIESANAAAAKLFKYDDETMCGVSLQSLIVEPFPADNIYKHFKNSQEVNGCCKDGSTIPLDLTIQRLKLNNNSTVYTCIIKDLTNRKNVQKERDLRELKNRFLSMMGHELSTPLTAISLSHDMLKKYRHIATDEENEQALDNIQHQVEHLRDMVKDVITLSRAESQGLEIEPEEVDLITYCRNVVEEFTFAYHRTHNVEFRCDERTIHAHIDSRMLRRVFTNLLSNGIKYSPQGGRVVFRLRANFERDTAQIQVVDSGIGIPAEDMPRLFEPFHRARNVDELPGTGLGLAVVKQIVELHRGHIKVRSVQGKGTTFSVVLPLRQNMKEDDITEEFVPERHDVKNARKS
jgi:PAS domain S-box-containing protein